MIRAQSLHVIVIGGGILGLTVARELAMRRGHSVTVLEKEAAWALHQTGRNSGVIHSGLYYKPGSLKARMCVAGNRSMIEYAKDRGIPVDICGKLVVATDDAERPRLQALLDRAQANGVPARMLAAAEAREYEPAVAPVAALRVESTAIISYRAVCESLAADLAGSGVALHTGQRVTGITGTAGRPRPEIVVQASSLEVRGDALVNCAGLHSDRVARLAGVNPGARIVPFRGEYYELRAARTSLVTGLIYPVPDPAFPFLGVHLTRMINGSVHAGPNAVLAMRREGYRWRDVSARDTAETLSYPGFWHLARRHYRAGMSEVVRSLSAARFAASVARLVPAVTEADIVRPGSACRPASRPEITVCLAAVVPVGMCRMANSGLTRIGGKADVARRTSLEALRWRVGRRQCVKEVGHGCQLDAGAQEGLPRTDGGAVGFGDGLRRCPGSRPLLQRNGSR